MGPFKIILTIAVVGSIAACGDTIPEQAAVGAAVGAGAAVVTSGAVLQSAAIGAGATVLACQSKLVDCN
ncbi:hypothetical protein [uncultured Sulfitobacter sp.]|uniref:hypothetical protein n=1 Tax=uncultured Sulfitobacter sp. TaxID=191468 RepID=UPI0026153DD4|nr:hypothetical protein [uncultured Sulfitobacter sp.]